MEMYSNDFGGVYPSRLDLLTPKYLKSIPNCPSAGSMTYLVQLGPNAKHNKQKFQDYYHIECSGQHHKEVSTPANFPSYNSAMGLVERPEHI